MARLLIYDAYENKVYTYTNLTQGERPHALQHPLTTLRLREFRGKIGQPYPVDHHCCYGSVEPDPPQIRQGHPGGIRLPPHLGGRPRHPQPNTMQA